ncbi:hypothetical protein Emag_000344 [Eimeria magna]
MTQKNVNGSTAGLVDLIASSGTTAESSSDTDEAHGAQKAIDRDSNTSWASESFEDMDEHPVFLDLNLVHTRDVADNPANPSTTTRDPLDGVAAQYLRINMRRPHPRLGKHEDMYRYAIKEISVFASKLEPGIGDCREAANSDDARDKYFIVYVSSFDSEFAKKVATLGTDLIAKRKSVEDASGMLEELFPDMSTCLEEKIQHDHRVSALSTAAGRLLSKFQQTTEFTKISTSDQIFIGLRLDGEGGIPIAYDYGCSYGSCSSSFHDLFDGATDLTGLVIALASSDASAATSTDTAGLGRAAGGKFSYFNLATTPLEAVLCSTNVTGELAQTPALSLKCEDTLAEHEAFKGTLNTNFLVECPAGCGDVESLHVFGSEGIYAERSSICKAAVHAGLIRSGGAFTVATESPSLSFEGSVQNGVESKSLHLSAGEVVRSMRLFKIRQQGYKSYTLNPQETTFKKEFMVEDSAYTRAGPSHWGFASLVSGHKNVVGQSTAIRGLAEIHGTYALLSRLNLYDFTLHVEFLDTSNGYLLLMHQKGGKKSLVRIEKGISKNLAEKEDGGFIQGVWHKVRIQALAGHIKVCIGEEDGQDAEIFSVLDERFVSGTVGFFSSGMEDGVYFDKLRIEAHPCETAKNELAPLPPQCSVFADTYFSSVSALYTIIDGDDKGGEAGHWEYRQASEPLDLPRSMPHFALTINFVNNRLRLRSTVAKKSNILGRTPMQRSLSGWHTLQVAFDGSRVAIRLQHPDVSATTQLVVNFQPQQKNSSDGSVGLSAFDCGGVAFDTIQLSPFHAEAATQPRFAGTKVSSKIWREHCTEMLHNKTAARQLACERDYCSECCAYHTSLLSTQHKTRCEKGCLRNADAAPAMKPNNDAPTWRALPGKEQSVFKHMMWLYEQKHNKKAVKQADAILKKFPEHGETLSMKGLILSNMGSDKKQEAYDYAKRGLRADITNCVCWHVLGLLYRQDKDYAEASKCFVQTLRLDPNNYQAMKDLANLQIHERNLQGFLETRRHILKARSRFIREWAAFAMANHLVGRLTVAQDILGEMENQFGESRDLDAFEKSEIMLYKAALLEEMGEYRKCYDYVSQREESILDETALLEMQGRMAIFLQEFERGRAAYRRLIEVNKDNECYLLGLMACAEDERIRSLFALPCCSLNGAIGKADSTDYLENLKHLNEKRIFRSNPEAYVYLMPRSLRSSGEDTGGWLESLFTRQAESEAFIRDPELTPLLGWKVCQKIKALPTFKVVRVLPPEIQDVVSSYFDGLRADHAPFPLADYVQLSFLTGSRFVSALDKFLRPQLRRGVVSLFSALRRLYTRNRVKLIGDVLESYVKHLEQCPSTFGPPVDGSLEKRQDSEAPIQEESSEIATCLLFAYMLLSQHYDLTGRTEKALETIQKGIDHTPTFADLYLVKGRIFKHAGAYEQAYEQHEKARNLDLADRSVFAELHFISRPNEKSFFSPNLMSLTKMIKVY